MRSAEVEVCRNRRLAVDHVAECGDAFLWRLYTISGNDQGE
jgi:hypothetical protein